VSLISLPSSAFPNMRSRTSAYFASRSSLVKAGFGFVSLPGVGLGSDIPLSPSTSEAAAEGPSEFAAVDVSEVLGSSGRRMIFRA
jgi:hypothetical protein